VTPAGLFRRVAVAEAVTWALLLSGMVVKYGTDAVSQGELGVRVFGMAHGIVFVAYCLTTLVVAVDQRWSAGRLVLGLVAAVPPFATLWFERYAATRGALGGAWRLVGEAPATVPERVVAWLLRHPARGILAGLVGVGVLTGAALLVGPPAG
jgi:integral membrane protein